MNWLEGLVARTLTSVGTAPCAGTAWPWFWWRFQLCVAASSLLAVHHVHAPVLGTENPPFWMEMAWEGCGDRHKVGLEGGRC